MRIAIGADHGGYPLNERVIKELGEAGHEIIDFGTHVGSRPDDYPDYAIKVGEAVRSGEAEIGILVCGSGVGASVAANKLQGIRADLLTPHVPKQKRQRHEAVDYDNKFGEASVHEKTSVVSGQWSVE